MATEISADLTPEVIDRATQMLQHLMDHGVEDIQAVLQAHFSNEELQTTLDQVEEIVNAAGVASAVCAYSGGTGQLCTAAGFPGEEGQQAIHVLKFNGNLHQCGRGRGKCLVVVHSAKPELEALQQKAKDLQENAKPKRKRRTNAEIAQAAEPTAQAASVVPEVFVNAISAYQDRVREIEEYRKRAVEAEAQLEEVIGQLHLVQRRVNEQALIGWQ